MSDNGYAGLLAVANGWKARAETAEAERDALAALCQEGAAVLERTANDTLDGRNMAVRLREANTTSLARLKAEWQVRGAVERYRLRKTPAPLGTPKFNPEKKARLLALAKQMVMEGKTLPEIAEEIERVSGKKIASNTVREWMPAHLTPRIRENARTAIAAHSRTRGYHQRQRLKAIMEENQRLRDEVRRLRGKLNRLERTTT